MATMIMLITPNNVCRRIQKSLIFVLKIAYGKICSSIVYTVCVGMKVHNSIQNQILSAFVDSTAWDNPDDITIYKH